MSSLSITANDPGKIVLLMGNEAIARGAIEAGVSVAASYPGTPASEIGDTFSRIADKVRLYFEWSTNEKVAFEVAFGASMCGLRSIVSMKHVGLNVALDILNLASLRGVKGGLVIVSADDPSQHSSGQEQDNRWLAKMNCIPVLEPSTPQDAKELTAYAFELSEKVRLPVMVRTVTRLSHMRSDVSLGRINKSDKKAEFDWEGFSYRVAGFAKLFYREKELNEKLDLVREEFESLSFNMLKLNGDERLGIVGAGLSFNYVVDAVRRLGVENNVAYLKLSSSYPLPENLVGRLLETVDELLVVEEVDPFVELHVKGLAKDFNPSLKLYGRMNGCLPKEGELNQIIVGDAISNLLGVDIRRESRLVLEKKAREVLFERMLTLCAGCPHRATLYALKEAVREVKGDLKSVVVNGDIGCYGLGHAPPISFEDTYFCMGASIGVSQGMSQVGVDSIAFIGDGTFFHAGIPALINAVYNRHNIKVVVADNQVIAMTGFQPHPQSGRTAMGKPTKRIMIEDIAKACGVDHVEVVDPYSLGKAKEAFTRMLKTEGVAMVIARRICATEAVRSMRPNRPTPYVVDPDLCIGCRICMTTFGCPALTWIDDEKKAVIDKALCMGCGVCMQICPQEAIKGSKVS
ncbi:indolepyruvate ferredoxin oxidoreductase subunit alpha [Candidatus Bathyarchaeota archaeon]|nr:indolepyruvate ferredoxin oxidoreductase subunit alpha [Candidatus Bathyarchaeota archaeon]MBS7630519.1 indolepyruvate ferredoxin oxidoreductase subunit alpha [Candidatus Bathyarchaeota archaeon]